MAAFSCNGKCHRHPCYSPKRLFGINFKPNIDAVCRKCQVYFLALKDRVCPCCKQKVSRHMRKGRSFKKKIFTAFADFWRRILKEKKQYELYTRRQNKQKGRMCIVCNSSKTAIHRGCEMWNRYQDGWMCQTCYNRFNYRKRVGNPLNIVIHPNYRK